MKRFAIITAACAALGGCSAKPAKVNIVTDISAILHAKQVDKRMGGAGTARYMVEQHNLNGDQLDVQTMFVNSVEKCLDQGMQRSKRFPVITACRQDTGTYHITSTGINYGPVRATFICQDGMCRKYTY